MVPSDFEDQVFAFLAARGFHPLDAALILAVSGGADSMALLEFWARAGAPRFRCALRVVHVHHGLRAAADLDQALVQSRCRELGLPLRLFRLDPGSRRTGESMEMWARRERYRCLEAVAAEAPDRAPRFILTGHHRDDLVETVFQRLGRGTGPLGLGGIPFRRAPGIVRPFLDRSRADIEAYLGLLGRPWREDESNADVSIGRNWYRHRYLPSLRSREADLDARILSLALSMQSLASRLVPLEEEAGLLFRDARGLPYLERGGVEARLAEGDAQALRHWLGRLAAETLHMEAETSGEAAEAPAATAESLRELRRQWLTGTRKLRVAMGPGAWLERRKDGFYWITGSRRNGQTRAGSRGKKECPGPDQRIILDHGAGTLAWRWGDRDYMLTVRTYPRPSELRFPGPREDRAIFDADLFSCTLLVRTRKDGDRFSPLGVASESRKLKVFLNEKKIPAGDRDRLPLVFAEGAEGAPNGETLAWVPGHGTSRFFKVGAQTANILEMELTCRNP